VSASMSVRLGAGATAIVAAGSAILSWDALSWGAGQLGVDGRLTWLYPVVIDGTIAVGTVAALALQGAHYRIRVYVWTLLAGAVGASVVGNGAHAAAGNLIHEIGAAVPAVALAASLHLLVILVRHSPAQSARAEGLLEAPESAPVEASAEQKVSASLDERAPSARPQRALAAPRPPARTQKAAVPERAKRAGNDRAESAPKRAPNGSRADEMRALLAEPGGRALTGDELGARLGIDPGYARRLRAEVERADAESARRPRVLEAAAPAAAATAAGEAN
jgi:hypothetical protein